MTASHHPSRISSYIQDTFDLLGDRDPIAVLSEMPEWLTQRLAGLSEDVLSRPEGPGKWSLHQVLVHLADIEIVFGWRLRMALAVDNAPIQGFDETAWITRFDTPGTTAAEALATFTALRRWNLRIWRSTTPEDLRRTTMHSERGEEPFTKLRGMIAGHDLRHRRQIDRILAAR